MPSFSLLYIILKSRFYWFILILMLTINLPNVEKQWSLDKRDMGMELVTRTKKVCPPLCYITYAFN